MKWFYWMVAALISLTAVSCAGVEDEPEYGEEGTPGDELSLGDIDGLDEIKADGWGYATVCKAIPDLEPLRDPYIVISLEGLTLHLVDRAGTYDRVFPIGPGAIKNGVSLTPVSTSRPNGLFYTRTDLAQVIDGPTSQTARWGYNYSCKIWWKDEAGRWSPVFAGLPFIRLEGPSSSGYGIHGPIDRYSQADGGDLRRGYVSHGCIRMESADLVEVYSLIQGHRTPVRIQQAVERDANDRAFDIENRWIMSECVEDTDCGAGLFCEQNPYSGRGFCTQACQQYCPDRYGYPTTYCVQNPMGGNSGICVFKATDLNNRCRRYDHFTEVQGVYRYNQRTNRADVCLPGSEGWIGDRCLTAADCVTGRCDAVDGGPEGICTQSCSRYCPDQAGGYAETFCIAEEDGEAGMCSSRCWSNDDCPMGTTCESSPRYSQPSVVRQACVPY